MRYNYFVPTEYQKFVQKCFQILKSREPGVIIFAPKMDRPRRINQLIQDHQTEIPFIRIDLIAGGTGDIDEIVIDIQNQIGTTPKKPHGIIISNAELFIYEKNYSMIDKLVQVQEANPNFRFLLFFEVDITHPDIARWITLTSVFTNIVYYPMYGYDDTMKFIDYCEDEWEFEIKSALKEKIFDYCGGHFWLVRQAMRELRDNPLMPFEEIFKTDQMRFRLEQIYRCFLDSERKVLQNIIRGQSVDGELEKHSYDFLKKMGFIVRDELTIPILVTYIRENLPRMTIEITERQVLLNDVNVDSHFSKKEKRVMKVLLDHRGKLVTRDQIAKALWPVNTEDYYSDWAVDRIISRLRNKLDEVGISKDTVKTLRNRGYILSN